MRLMFIPKKIWATEEPRETVGSLVLPARYVFFGYTKKDYSLPNSKPSPGPRPSYSHCFEEVKYLLKGDLRTYLDIRYNFLIGPEGGIFEGRGWHKEPGLPNRYRKLAKYSLFVTYIGDFTEESPSEEVFEAREQFMIYGVRHNFIQHRCCEVSLER